MPKTARKALSEIPALSTLQFNTGEVISNVNLFRGNLAFPLKVLSLPGRGGAVVDVTLMYQSGVHRQVDEWNMTATSETVGLGWSLPVEAITMDAKENVSRGDAPYYLHHRGQTIPLIPLASGWDRALLPASESASLESGTLSTTTRETMAQAGWPLSETARLEARTTAGVWDLYDSGFQRDFVIRENPEGGFDVFSGGESFDAQTFQYWQISFFADYERWEVVLPTGELHSYGGAFDGQGEDPNGLRRGVRWGNWVGPSVQSEGWSTFTTGWNLVTVVDTTGQETRYSYQTVERSLAPSSGSPPGDVPSYTSECVLASITNDLGWTCAFHYQSKTYDATTLEAPKEYLIQALDPMLDPATPTAWQQPSSCLYLDQIAVTSATNQLQATVVLEYHDLVNVSPRDDDNLLAYGATYKRYLKGLREVLPNGESRPSIEFAYEWGTDSGKNRGALTRILYPTGSTTRFTYEAVEAGADDGDEPGARNLTIPNPFGSSQEGAPRVWYGNDYVINGWVGGSGGDLALNVYTWIGRWSPSFDTWLTFTESINLDKIQVAASENCFLLVVPNSTNTRSNVYLFHRFPSAVATWVPDTDEQGSLIAYSYENSNLVLSQGDDFFLITDNDNSVCDRYAWNKFTKSWEVVELADEGSLCPAGTGFPYSYTTAARSNSYVLMCYDVNSASSRFSVFWRDSDWIWYQGGTLTSSEITIARRDNSSYFQMDCGPSFVAMAYVTSFSGSSEITSFDYEVAVLSWDEDFQDLTFASLPEVSEEDTFNNVPIGILASVGPVATVGGAAIGTGPNIFRFDGVEWTYHTLGITYSGFNDPSTQYYWYGYSDTSIIKTENTISGIVSELSCFDPSNPEAGWSTLTLQDSDSDSGRYTEGFPTLTNEVASQDSTVYPRSVWPQWTQVPVSMQADLQAAGIDTTTMVNQSPHFLAFMTRDDGGDPQETKVVFFRNGGLMRDDQGQVLVETFTGQQMFQILDPTHRYQTALSGKLPAIPDGFVTFPAGSDLDATDQITLHHYANYSVRDPIQAWVVQSITIDSGYQSLERCYAYADLSAATDGTGTVLQFEKVTEYSACSEPSDQAYGYTVSYFYNGLPPTSTGVQEASEGEDHDVLEQSYSLLSGLSRSKEVYDHGDDLQSQTVNTWAVSTQVATSPDGSSSRDLYVGMPQITSILESQQGIGRSMDFTYDPASGSPSSVISSYYDSTGRLLLQRRTSEFAFQIYPDLWTRNILAPVAQAVLESQYDGDAQWQRIALTVHTFEAWTRADGSIYWAEKDTWIPKQADSPDFAWWTGETPPSTWQAKSCILERNDQGAVALRLDPLGHPTLTLYDDAARFPIATFGNTDAGACYDSFETYQAATWSASPGSSAAVIDDDAFTGEQCVQISASSTFERRLTLPRDMDGSSWVFGLWLKVPSEGAIPRVTLEFSYQGATLSKVLSPTPGQWKAAQWIADLSALNVAAGAELTLSIVSEIDAGQWLRLDDLWVTPLTAQFGATAYDSERMTQSASLAANGVCSRRLYNSFLEANVAITAGTGEVATGCVKSITAPFFTRQLTPMTDGEPFPTDTPNLVITAMGRDPGILDQFKAGALSDYSALEGSLDSWTCSERRLTHTGSSDSPLGDRLRRDDFSAESLAISVQVNGEDTSAPDGVVSVGCGRYAVSWTGSEWQLIDDGDTTPVTLARSTLTAWQKEWLLMVFETRILFFANGALLFSYDDEAVEGSDHGVVLGLGGDGYFQNLAVTENLGLKLAYSDGLSRALQTLTMESGRTTLLASGLFDDRGNAAISIRPSRLTTDTTADPFLYQPDYVTNADFSSDLWDGGPMTGQVVDLYHPGDGGYPFARTAFEASPLNRSVAAGKPGYDFAIRPGNQRVVATSFGSNEDPGPFLYALPVGEYHQVVDTDADGTVTVTTLDTAGNTIGTVVSSEGESAPWINSRVFDVLGRPIASLAPATYAEGITQGGEIPASATTATFNFWGQRISTTTPDTGTDRCVYTAVSQPRFLQDADGAAQGYFLYRKYDTQGRMTEVGWVAGDWDQDQLQSLADEDPSWPGTGASAYVRNTFDGTDDTPCMVGRLWRAEVDNSAENGGDLPLEGDEQSGLVVDTFAYDVGGNLLQHTREFEDFEAVSPISLTMAYSASGALLSTTDSVTEITHRKERNPAGRIVGVETVQDSASTTLATVEYTPAGKLQASTLLPASLAMLRSYDYASPEWPSSISDPILQETLTYTHGNADGGGYWTGAIASQSISVAGDEENQAFAVNGLGQMTAGQPGDGSSSAAMAWQLGPNGTFQTRTRDSVEEVFAYEPTPGSNRLVEISGDATSQRLSYCDNGAVRTITGDPDGDLSLTYGRTGGNLSTVQRTDSNGTTQITYHYGARGRAIRQVQGANPITALSLGHGGDATVILLSGETQRVIRLLSTPDTAVAISDGTTYLGLADHLGSIRAVIDDSGQVQGQYTYDLYGGTTVVQSPPIPWTTLFTGQTYDSDAGLYLFGMRPYHPGLSQFLMPDPRFEGPSPYSYTANNPILLTDPTGGSVQGMIAGIAVGATVTLAIGVAGVFTLGAGFAAAAAVGAVAGAVGSLAGDATTARVDGDRMTQKRIGIDLLAGAAGGVAGAMAGGAAGQLAARGALAAGFTARAITTTASLASGISGGIGGALASSGVSAGMTHQPLFSESLGVNIAVGAVAGAGAGVMAAGAHMGWTRLGGDVGVYPVELTEPGEINAQDPTGTHGSAGGLRGRVRILAPHDRLTGELESRWTRWVASGDSQAAVDWERSLTTVALGPDPAIATDTVALHGLPRYGLAEWQAPSGEYMNRPINSRTLAAYLRGEGYGAEGSGQPVKLVICFGATPGRLSLAQGLANELQVDVYAQRGVVNPFGDTSQGPWLRFQPR